MNTNYKNILKRPFIFITKFRVADFIVQEVAGVKDNLQN